MNVQSFWRLSKAVLLLAAVQCLLAPFVLPKPMRGYNDQLVEDAQRANATAAATVPQSASLSSPQKCAQCILHKQQVADYCKDSIYKPGTCCLKAAVADAEQCQSSQLWYFARGYDGDLWPRDWLRADGIVPDNKRVRLYTYIDDIEGRRNNTDEESDEVGDKKAKEEDEAMDAQERADQQDLAELLNRKPTQGIKKEEKKKVNLEALVAEDKVLCSSALNEMVSFYAQYELCQEAEQQLPVCGAKQAISASIQPQFLSSLHPTYAAKSASKMGKQFPTYTVCHYQIFNPSPNRTLYLNIYRETNLTDIGVYYERPEVNQEEVFDNLQLTENDEFPQNITHDEMEAARLDGKV